MHEDNLYIGERITIGQVEFTGHTAKRIIELGVPVLSKMAHIVELADESWRASSGIVQAQQAAHQRQSQAKKRLEQAEELLRRGAPSQRMLAEIEAEHASSVTQLEIAQADVRRLDEKASKVDHSITRLRDACLKVLATELGGLAPNVFEALNWK